MSRDKFTILVHPVTGKQRKVKNGFSKTVFFFSVFALLVRRQFKAVAMIMGIYFIMVTVDIAIINGMFGIVTPPILEFLFTFSAWSAYSFLANKHLLEQLLEKGYKVYTQFDVETQGNRLSERILPDNIITQNEHYAMVEHTDIICSKDGDNLYQSKNTYDQPSRSRMVVKVKRGDGRHAASIKMFAQNLCFSFLAFIVISVISFYIIGALYPFYSCEGFNYAPLWIYIVMWIHVVVTIATLFLVGTKLYLLSTHWLNYLSVLGVTVLMLVTAFVDSNLAIFITWPFSILSNVIGNLVKGNFYIELIIIAFLPSIIMWLGMFTKSKIRDCPRKTGDGSLS